MKPIFAPKSIRIEEVRWICLNDFSSYKYFKNENAGRG